MSNFKFELLDREACKASIMIEGLTGRGKSGLALMLAYGLEGGFREDVSPEERAAAWKKVFAVDAENRSLNLFVGIPASFGGQYGRPYGLNLSADDGYAPSNYLAAREAAVKAGAGTFIEDSITHMWTAKGGVLDLVGKAKEKNPKLDNYRVWNVPEVAAEKQNLIETIRDNRCHVISTVRVKEKFDMVQEEGKTKIVSLGEQQLQQDGLKYEPDLVLQMRSPGRGGSPHKHPVAHVYKSRYAILSEGEEYAFTPELCEQLRAYLADGVDPNELLEKQRQDYILAVKDILDKDQAIRTMWNVLKTDLGHADTKLVDLPLDILKRLYGQIMN